MLCTFVAGSFSNILAGGIYPPKEGVDVPQAYFDRIAEDPTAFEMQRAYIKVVERIKRNREAVQRGIMTISEAQLEGGTVVSGTRTIPVLTGKYANTGADPYSVSTLQQELFDGPWPTGTMKDYYHEISYNNLTVDGTVFDWFTVSNNDTYYEGPLGCNGICGSARTGEFLKELLDANDGVVDFGQYDNDGPDGVPNSGDDDGYVDFVAFVHPEIGGECGNYNIWSHRWVYRGWWGAAYTTNDSAAGGGMIRVDDYVIQPALGCSGGMIEIGVFCHEFGHAFGLPDLYDTDGSSSGLGNWALMASGSWGGNNASPETPSHMSAWSKIQLGWITPTVPKTDVSDEAIVEVENNPQAFKLWTDGSPVNEYFLVENRQRTGFDSSLRECGLLIYHVDDNMSTNRYENCGSDIQNPSLHFLVALEQADGDCDLEARSNRGDGGDPYPGSSDNMSFDALSKPKSNSYAGADTYVAVTNISDCGSTMYADIQVQSIAEPTSESVVVVARKKSNGSYKLQLYDPPDRVGGDTGPVIASDNDIGKKISYIGAGNFDGDPEIEVAIVRIKSDKSYKLQIYDLPDTVGGDTGPAICSDNDIGKKIKAVAVANFDDNPGDELGILRKKSDNRYKFQIYDSPCTVGAAELIASDDDMGKKIIKNGLAAGNFDDDPDIEVAVLRIKSDATHKLEIYDVPEMVDGDTGPAIASDDSIGKKIRHVAASDFFSAPGDELAVCYIKSNGTYKLKFYAAPDSVGGDTGPAIASDSDVGKKIKAMAAVESNFDSYILEDCTEALYYDTGRPDHYWGGGDVGLAIAVRFTPPSYPWVFDLAQFWPGSMSETLDIEVHVWDDDGPGGMPGSDLIPPVAHNCTGVESWENVNLPSITIDSGDFYIGWFQTTAATYYNADDDDVSYDGRSYARFPDGTWFNYSDFLVYDNVMIRQGCQGAAVPDVQAAASEPAGPASTILE
jgi:M6 family metalloprotease-like protein